MATYSAGEQRQMDIAGEAMVPDVDYTKVPRIYWVTCLEPGDGGGPCPAGVPVSINGVPTRQTKCPKHGGDAVDVSNAGPAEPQGEPR